MNMPAIFAFNAAAVRVFNINDVPWFMAGDVAGILGYRDALNMVRMLDDDEKGTHIVSTLGGDQEVSTINESGLYACVLKSRRPEAKTFRKWITSEVLPAIRQRGGYAMPGADGPAPTFTTRQLDHGADLAVSADRTFRAFQRSARAAGLSLPAALKVANAQTVARTGMNMLNELGMDVGEPAPDSLPPIPPPPDPVVEAVKLWVTRANDDWYTMEQIVFEALGAKPGAREHMRLMLLAARTLTAMGFIHRRMRIDGKRSRNHWRKRAPE